MAWAYLVVAGLLEVAWASAMKYSEGFTRFWPSAGAVGSAVVGMMVLGEPRDAVRIICILLILGGIVGLKLTSSR